MISIQLHVEQRLWHILQNIMYQRSRVRIQFIGKVQNQKCPIIRLEMFKENETRKVILEKCSLYRSLIRHNGWFSCIALQVGRYLESLSQCFSLIVFSLPIYFLSHLISIPFFQHCHIPPTSLSEYKGAADCLLIHGNELRQRFHVRFYCFELQIGAVLDSIIQLLS